jgi:hypothetical protein
MSFWGMGLLKIYAPFVCPTAAREEKIWLHPPLAKTLNQLLNRWCFIEQLSHVCRRETRACRRNN